MVGIIIGSIVGLIVLVSIVIGIVNLITTGKWAPDRNARKLFRKQKVKIGDTAIKVDKPLTPREIMSLTPKQRAALQMKLELESQSLLSQAQEPKKP